VRGGGDGEPSAGQCTTFWGDWDAGGEDDEEAMKKISEAIKRNSGK